MSIVIPTHGRPGKLSRLLGDVAAFAAGEAVEAIVVVDGPDEGASAARELIAGKASCEFLTIPHGGPAAARNAGLEIARGDWALFLNDDARLAPGTIRGHLARKSADAKARRAYLGRFDFVPAVIDSAWRRMLAETSMLFFYGGMRSDQLYGYRHFWTCNVSLRTDLVREAGGFRVELNDGLGCEAMSFHEDIELGWRLARRFGVEVCYAAEIACGHDHGLSPRDYFRREYRSGRAARAAAGVNREFHDETWSWVGDAAAQFDVLRRSLGRQWREMRRELETMRQRPASDVSRSELRAVYLAHLPLKRGAFLAGYAGREFREVWPETEWD